MKKILALFAAAMLLSIQPAGAQAFLNKLKEKAGTAIGNAISEKLGNKVEEEVAGKTDIDVNAFAEVEERQQLSSAAPAVITPEQQLQRRRASSFGWDGKVTPSTAQFPIPLLNEFPAVPAAQELANPTEAGMISYYNAIKKVTLRAEELNADTTCEDEFSEEWRKKQENKVREAFGLTEQEWNLLNSGNATDAQREAIENKIQMAMFGGVDMQKAAADAQANMKKYENMSEADREAEMMMKTTKAIVAVYKQDPAETKYVTGMTPDEVEKALMEEMEFQAKAVKNSNYNGAGGPMAKKMQEYEKTMTARDGSAYKKRADAMNKKVQSASMKAMQDMESIGSLMAGLDNMRNLEDKIGMKDVQAAERSYYDASVPMMNAIEVGSDIDAKFSAAERKKVQAIKEQIYSTDDPLKYNPLYLQALEAIKTYRVRAAGLWSAAIQKRFNDVKALMPDYIKAQRKAVEDGIIPECGLWRAPLNVVIEAGDILEEAYSEFPCDYPPMYLEELKDELVLKENEHIWWPEHYALGNINDILMRKFLFKAVYGDGEYKIYQWEGADWKPVPDDFDETKFEKVEEPQSAVWKSRDGKREIIYNAEGHWILLPEGDMIYPIALDKQDDAITWVVMKEFDQSNENTTQTRTLQIYKCTYKL